MAVQGKYDKKVAIMVRVKLIAGIILLGVAPGVLEAAQKHPSVVAGTPETEATRLHEELANRKKILIIDVRSPKEFAAGHVPEAVNIPFDDLEKGIAGRHVSKDTTIVTMCDHGGRSSRAVVLLQKLGYKATSFCRLDSWKDKGYKIETGKPDPPPTAKVYKFICHHYCQGDKVTADLNEICECACQKPYRECMKAD